MRATNHDGQGALHLATVTGTNRCCRFIAWLLALPIGSINIHQEDDDGLNALDLACVHNQTAIYELLSSAGMVHSVTFLTIKPYLSLGSAEAVDLLDDVIASLRSLCT